MKWIARMFGMCGHEWNWEPSKMTNVEGEVRRTQQATCQRCGKWRSRVCFVDGLLK